MKAKHDFSKAVRGKFARPDIELVWPVYLEEDVEKYISQLAHERHTDVQSFVNQWLRANIKLLRSTK